MLPTPVAVGPFRVGEDGRLDLLLPTLTPRFTFHWRGRRFAVDLTRGGMDVSVGIGQVPSTSAHASLRAPAFATARALPDNLPSDWKLRLMPDHKLRVDHRSPMAWPTTITDLMKPLIGFLLALAPVLDVIDECGLGAEMDLPNQT